MVQENVEAVVVQVRPLGDAVARYCVIALPPVLSGAAQEIRIEPFWAVKATFLGTEGAVAGVLETDDRDA